MMKLRKLLVLAVVVTAASALLAAGCSKKEDAGAQVGADGEKSAESKEAVMETEKNREAAQGNDSANDNGGQAANPNLVTELPQLAPLKAGETLVTLETTLGDITVRFFPQYAPKAVENFVTHAKDGYYDGVIFHRVMPGFMIQGGDPLGTGTGGESIWGGGFGLETTPNLRHFNGALAMAHSSAPDSNGSQFYIVENSDVGADLKGQLTELLDTQDEVLGQDGAGNNVYVKDIYPPDVVNAYVEKGGALSLDSGYTVFGQVVTGQDVVEKIANVEVDDPNSQAPKPITDVVINRAVVSEYAP